MTEMERKKLSEILTCAADLFQEKGWTQDVLSRNAEGVPVDCEDPSAASYCLLGAFYACQDKEIFFGGTLLQPLDNNRKTSLAHFNDRKGMTKERVIAKLRTLSRKAKRLEETGGATWE